MDLVSPATLDFTLDEVEAIEEIVDAPASEWATCKQGKLMKAMVLTVRRRSDPKATMAEVGKLRLSEMEAELNPTVAEDTAAS